MTPEQESALGAAMKAHAVAEGHLPLMPSTERSQRKPRAEAPTIAGRDPAERERRVLERLRDAPATYSAIARSTGIPNGTVWSVLERLRAKGHDIEREQIGGVGGQVLYTLQEAEQA